MLASATSGPNGITAQAASAGMMVITGPRKNSGLVRRGGQDDLLEDQLHRIGDRRQQAVRADAVRAGPDLRPADALALPQREVGDAAHQRQHQRDDLDQAPDAPASVPPRRELPQVVKLSIMTSGLLDPTAPNIAPSVGGVGDGRRRRAPRSPASVASQRAGSMRLRGALRHAHLVAGLQAQLLPQRRRQADNRRACVGGGLQRRRAPHQRIGGVDRHVGHALEPARAGACSRAIAAAVRLSSAWTAMPAVAQRFGAHLFGRGLESKPARPSRLPSTRSTFQAGRVSPSGLTTPWKLCTRPSALTKLPGGLGERRDRQQHVGDVGGGVLERRQRHHQPGARQRRARRGGIGGVEHRLDVEQQQRLHRLRRQHLAGVQPAVAGQRADQLRADPVGRFAEVADRGAGLFARSTAPAPASCDACGCCAAALPSSTALRSPLSSDVGDRPARSRSDRPAAGAAMPLACGDGRGHLGQRLRPAARRGGERAASGHRPVVVHRVQAEQLARRGAPPGACAARTGDGPCAGRSRPRSTRCSVRQRRDRACRASARGRPAPRWRSRHGAVRWSMFSLPRPRTSLASRCSSSTVRVRRTERADARPHRGSAVMRFRPSAT